MSTVLRENLVLTTSTEAHNLGTGKWLDRKSPRYVPWFKSRTCLCTAMTSSRFLLGSSCNLTWIYILIHLCGVKWGGLCYKGGERYPLHALMNVL
jgi:hypothetical protein